VKRLMVLGAIFCAGVIAAAAATSPSAAGPAKKTTTGTTTTTSKKQPKKVTVVIQTTDNGCAGNPWANDTIRRTLKVHRNKNGSYRIREEDKGTFVTSAGGMTASPGNCPENKTKHGTKVRAGVNGTFKGYITGTVTGGTFNRNATCTANPCMQAAFIAAFFGPTAQFSCRTTSADCKFKYDYHAKKNQNLLFRHWTDRGTGAGALLKERFTGDIADQ
jgi:hypothetical protein